MKQLITRVDDRLLDGVKERARREGVSVNTFVNRLLARAVESDDQNRDIERRIAAAGLTVHVTPGMVPPSREEVIEMMRGAGTSVSDALDWARGGR